MNCVLIFLVLFLANNVYSASLTREEDALVTKLLDTIEKRDAVPRLGKREVPRLGREIEDVPRLGREIELVPRLGREAEEVPRLGREAEEVPRLGREVELVPRLGREVELVPRLGREVEVPRLGREVPRLGRGIDEVPRLGREVPRLGRELEVPRLGREVPRLGKREIPRLGKREVPRLGRREVPRLGREASTYDLKQLYNQLKREVSNDMIEAEIKEEKRVLKAFDLGTRGLILRRIGDKLNKDGFSDQKRDMNEKESSRPFLHVKRTNLLSLIEKLTSEE
ncbi:uncharacterized protein [Clytia hemisphaerica]|uniref:Pp3 n=2 Tax=Clytia hemisphaerica TaxID=252671 RepID=A0A1W6LRX7_9CNID|nr:pp3 precursor [Clytia hemisphaerica]